MPATEKIKMSTVQEPAATALSSAPADSAADIIRRVARHLPQIEHWRPPENCRAGDALTAAAAAAAGAY